MRLSIQHETRYDYGEKADYSIQRLRLVPRPHDGQSIVRWDVEAPGMKTAARYRDAFGNQVYLVSCPLGHRGTIVRASGIVETRERSGIVSGLVEPAPVWIYGRTTERTEPDERVREIASRVAEADPLEQMHDLMSLVADAIEYEPGATDHSTTAAEALSLGRGVCQDYAHAFISAARLLERPARYVTGYLLVGPGGHHEAHHAWAEVHLPGLGWVGFDPSNRVCPTEQYVRLAAGLDAVQAAPVEGWRRGPGHEALAVAVRVQQQSSSQ